MVRVCIVCKIDEDGAGLITVVIASITLRVLEIISKMATPSRQCILTVADYWLLAVDRSDNLF